MYRIYATFRAGEGAAPLLEKSDNFKSQKFERSGFPMSAPGAITGELHCVQRKIALLTVGLLKKHTVLLRDPVFQRLILL